MLSRVTELLLLLTLAAFLNLTAQEISITVFVYDAETEEPIESALVTVLWNGTRVDSVFTDIHGNANISRLLTNLVETGEMPSSISISNNYPNPFVDKTNVEMSIPETQTITASVYNIVGQRVASDQMQVNSGNYTLNLSLGHLSKGVYFLRVSGRESNAIKLIKMGDNIQNSFPLFSVSTSSLPSNMIMGKIADDVFRLKVTKELYAVYETQLNETENSEIAIPLTHINNDELSKDATLSDLRVDNETVDGFEPEIFTYDIVLPLGTTKIPIVGADATDPSAKVKITQAPSVTGTALVEITAGDGITQLIYDVNFEISSNERVTDIDGNSYNTKIMGMMDAGGNISFKQWMTENLRVTHYRNGDPIINVVDPNWNRTGTPPNHRWDRNRRRWDVSQGFPGVEIGDRIDATHWNLINYETFRDEGFLAAVEEMISDTSKNVIGSEAYWYILGTEGLSTYKDGVLLSPSSTNPNPYGGIGAYSAIPYWYVEEGTFMQPHNQNELIEMYGLQYNWYAVKDERGLCPEGWHIPSDEEWKQIERYIIHEVKPELTQQQINRIVNGSGWRGGEYQEHNINLGGRMKTQNSFGIEMGRVTGNLGDNFVTSHTSLDQEKQSQLKAGDKIRITGHYYEGQEFIITAINLPTITLNGNLSQNYRYNNTDAFRGPWLILIPEDPRDIPYEHPLWGESIQPINAGGSVFSGGNSSGFNIYSAGWNQYHRFWNSDAENWWPESIHAYRNFYTRFWTSTGEDSQGNPYTWTEDIYSNNPFPMPAQPAAMMRRFMATESGIARNPEWERRDGSGVRCIKDE
jgi:uncharacterized protein (TIGR02145 family)